MHERLGDARIALKPPQVRPDARACKLETIYFGVDSAVVDEHARETVLAAVTCYTRAGMPAALVITGATDPRGTEEYNLALGQRRAAAVQHLLVILGIAPARISINSVGEELATGRDEDGWRLDRRAVATSH